MAKSKWAEQPMESEKQKYYYTIHCVHTIVWMQSRPALSFHIQKSTHKQWCWIQKEHTKCAHTRPLFLTSYSKSVCTIITIIIMTIKIIVPFNPHFVCHKTYHPHPESFNLRWSMKYDIPHSTLVCCVYHCVYDSIHTVRHTPIYIYMYVVAWRQDIPWIQWTKKMKWNEKKTANGMQSAYTHTTGRRKSLLNILKWQNHTEANQKRNWGCEKEWNKKADCE